MWICENFNRPCQEIVSLYGNAGASRIDIITFRAKVLTFAANVITVVANVITFQPNAITFVANVITFAVTGITFATNVIMLDLKNYVCSKRNAERF
jgi:phage-related protein